MPRAAGQIDLQKNEAILDAAAAVLNERGMAAPIETIARMAGVSKQTIYNHYGSKAELVKALMAKRFLRLVKSIEADPDARNPEGALTQFALQMLQPSLNPASVSLVRIMILAGEELHDLSREIYDAGPGAALDLTARYLADCHRQGVLEVEEPRVAAEMFIGMVLGHRQLRQMLRLAPWLKPEDAERIAGETARRFVRAYSPGYQAA